MPRRHRMKKKSTPKPLGTRNLVAKHARKFNVARVHVDRKKESKKRGPRPEEIG